MKSTNNKSVNALISCKAKNCKAKLGFNLVTLIFLSTMLPTILSIMLPLMFQSETALAEEQKALTKTELLKYVEKFQGPIAATEDMPQTLEILTPIATALSNVQDERMDGVASSSEVRIVFSKNINAFVKVIHDRNKRRAKNLVFITTGMLQFFLDPTLEPSQIKGRIEELAGVIAHELGHPTDKLDDKGIENHYEMQGDQAVELRADAEAIELLRAAGLPPDANYRALKRAFAKQKAGAKLLSAIKSHPEKNVRLMANRARLTLDRMNLGMSQEKQSLIPNATALYNSQILSEVRDIDLTPEIILPKDLRDLSTKVLGFMSGKAPLSGLTP